MQAILARVKEGAPHGLVFFTGSIELVETDAGTALVAKTSPFQEDAFVFPTVADAQGWANNFYLWGVGFERFATYPWISNPHADAPRRAADGAGAVPQAPTAGGSGAEEFSVEGDQ